MDKPDAFYQGLASVCKIEFLSVLPPPSAAVLTIVSASVAKKFLVAPVSLEPEPSQDEHTLCLALSDPLNFSLVDNLRYQFRRDIWFVVATPVEIQRVIAECYPQEF